MATGVLIKVFCFCFCFFNYEKQTAVHLPQPYSAFGHPEVNSQPELCACLHTLPFAHQVVGNLAGVTNQDGEL